MSNPTIQPGGTESSWSQAQPDTASRARSVCTVHCREGCAGQDRHLQLLEGLQLCGGEVHRAGSQVSLGQPAAVEQLPVLPQVLNPGHL